MRYWFWRFRAFVYILSLNISELRRVWRDRWRIRQAWTHAMTAGNWEDYYNDGYAPREAMNEDASCA